MEAWYAVHTKARQERLAVEHLIRQHYRTHLPLICLPKRRRGRWCEVVEPLFPGYLFVRLDPGRHNMAPIGSTRGVIGLVRFGGGLRPVPQGLVDDLQAAQREGDTAIRRQHLFQPGDPVEIVSGPMAGLRAIFLAPSGRERAHLLLDLLGRSNRIAVSQHQLIPAS
jgi:transcriptional antiterminator RfaH